MAKKNDKKTALAKLSYPEISEQDDVRYANYIAVNHTPWDFSLHFGLVTAPIGPQKQTSGVVEIPVKKLVTVNIPTTIIKGLIKALETNVELYEKAHGEIKGKEDIKQ